MKKKQEIPEEIREAAEAAADSGQQTADSEEKADGGQQTSDSNEASAEVSAEAKDGGEPEKLAQDVAAFHELFPEVKAEAIPGEVWDQVEAGQSLTAAYAVHFVKAMKEAARIEKRNAENEKAAPPPVRHDGKEESYFSPEAVSAMSREEVRKNYQEILRSMDHWN